MLYNDSLWAVFTAVCMYAVELVVYWRCVLISRCVWQAAERLQIRGLVRLPADGESSSEEEDEEEGEREGARRTEHRQAAAAALASRAPWPAGPEEGAPDRHTELADLQVSAAAGELLPVQHILLRAPTAM